MHLLLVFCLVYLFGYLSGSLSKRSQNNKKLLFISYNNIILSIINYIQVKAILNYVKFLIDMTWGHTKINTVSDNCVKQCVTETKTKVIISYLFRHTFLHSKKMQYFSTIREETNNTNNLFILILLYNLRGLNILGYNPSRR